MTAPAGREGEFVQSLERGLTVIRALRAPEPATLSEVARATGLSRAAARRFLHTLARLGYVKESGGRFRLTAQVLELGYAYLSSLTLPELAQPHLEELAETVHESSSVSVLDGDDIVYVARVPTRRIMTVAISVGTRFPAYATSMGRVLLAGLAGGELDAYLARADLAELTAATLTRPPALRAELDRVRRQGWAVVDQELEPGLRSVAAPIHDRAGEVVAAVNISAHAGRTTLDQLRRAVVPQVVATARRIERDLANQLRAQRAAVALTCSRLPVAVSRCSASGTGSRPVSSRTCGLTGSRLPSRIAWYVLTQARTCHSGAPKSAREANASSTVSSSKRIGLPLASAISAAASPSEKLSRPVSSYVRRSWPPVVSTAAAAAATSSRRIADTRPSPAGPLM